MSMNQQQVRVIDPILTSVSQGYQNAEFVGSVLFPAVPVGVSGGQIIEFGKESFKKYNLRRIPGTGTKRINFGYAGKPFALVQDALEVPVPREDMRDAQKVPGINLGTEAANTGMDIASLALEIDQATIARNAANYDSDHKIDKAAAKWTNNANNPTTDISVGREAVRQSIGRYPNVALVSATAFAAAQNNTNVKENFKYTSSDSITAEMLAKLWQVEEVRVGMAVWSDDDGDFTDVWGNDVILAYVPKTVRSRRQPSYGYTYTMEGHPMVEVSYYDNNAKSWIYPVTYERAPVLAGMSAGYLIQNVAG